MKIIKKIKNNANLVIGLLTIIVLILVSIGQFETPKIYIDKTAETDCPQTISKTFDINFYNHGNKEGTIYVKAESNEIKFENEEEKLLIPPGKTRTISLKITEISNVQKLTIKYEWKYKKIILNQKTKTICEYERDKYTPNKYNLVE